MCYRPQSVVVQLPVHEGSNFTFSDDVESVIGRMPYSVWMFVQCADGKVKRAMPMSGIAES